MSQPWQVRSRTTGQLLKQRILDLVRDVCTVQVSVRDCNIRWFLDSPNFKRWRNTFESVVDDGGGVSRLQFTIMHRDVPHLVASLSASGVAVESVNPDVGLIEITCRDSPYLQVAARSWNNVNILQGPPGTVVSVYRAPFSQIPRLVQQLVSLGIAVEGVNKVGDNNYQQQRSYQPQQMSPPHHQSDFQPRQTSRGPMQSSYSSSPLGQSSQARWDDFAAATTAPSQQAMMQSATPARSQYDMGGSMGGSMFAAETQPLVPAGSFVNPGGKYQQPFFDQSQPLDQSWLSTTSHEEQYEAQDMGGSRSKQLSKSVTFAEDPLEADKRKLMQLEKEIRSARFQRDPTNINNMDPQKLQQELSSRPPPPPLNPVAPANPQYKRSSDEIGATTTLNLPDSGHRYTSDGSFTKGFHPPMREDSKLPPMKTSLKQSAVHRNTPTGKYYF